MALYILILPLLTSLVCGIFNKSLSQKFVKTISISFMLIASLISIKIFYSQIESDNSSYKFLYEWINIHVIQINIGIYVDRLTSIMFCVVTIVSTIVHIYSTSYMEEDKNLNKFLSYLSLFTFFMLLLVCSDNLLQLFIGWEGVGLCSYLLIGYWYEKKSANDAAIKAFVTNRVGDFAFLIALMMLFFYTRSLNFYEIFNSISDLEYINIDILNVEFKAINVICLLLFVGCMGKSAQLGLHIWLPDAMEGPTPVSALIHAATMVTAGVFLVVRMSPLFECANSVRDFILIIGSLTCLIMAIIAVTNNDIKKIIAYSTCSQLGYMFIACGSSYYDSAIFHLATHAFFKALLFLCAGNIIHMTHEQDLNKLGGLMGKMNITFTLFIIGSLALVGMYPFSGYYSKDMIIENLSHSDKPLYQFAYICSLCGVFFTSLYSSKLLIKIFFGKNSNKNVKEAPSTMTLPLMTLAFGSIFAGSYGIYVLDIGGDFFSNSMIIHPSSESTIESIKEIYPTIIVILGMFVGSIIYTGKSKDDLVLKDHKSFQTHDLIEFFRISRNYENNFIYQLFKNKLYFDEFYNITILYLVKFLSIFSSVVDNDIIDRQGPMRSRKIIKSLSLSLSKIQNGYIYFYSTLGMVGIVSSLFWIIIIRY